jgi:uncharacterized integral membrane protein
MNKVKSIAFLILFALVVLFTYENWVHPEPTIKFLTFTFPSIPYVLVIYASLLIGFVAGWLVHARRVKKSQKEF